MFTRAAGLVPWGRASASPERRTRVFLETALRGGLRSDLEFGAAVIRSHLRAIALCGPAHEEREVCWGPLGACALGRARQPLPVPSSQGDRPSSLERPLAVGAGVLCVPRPASARRGAHSVTGAVFWPFSLKPPKNDSAKFTPLLPQTTVRPPARFSCAGSPRRIAGRPGLQAPRDSLGLMT